MSKASKSLQIGTITVTCVSEIEAGAVIQSIIPKATKEAVRDITWLVPHFADDHGNLKAQVQTFLLQVAGKKIVIDTCVGNCKQRNEIPQWDDLQTSFLSNLGAICSPEDIDIVVCTHLHFDHVGWNTKLVDGGWVPTFPNARYLFVDDEFKYWKTTPEAEIEDDHEGIRDSVIPVVEAGLADFVKTNHHVTEGVSLFPTPGHTPHHVSVMIESGGQVAIITGDVLHHPCQIAHPEWMSFDTNSDQALRTRHKFLNDFTETKTLIIGSHFSAPSAGRISKDGDCFRLEISKQA